MEKTFDLTIIGIDFFKLTLPAYMLVVITTTSYTPPDIFAPVYPPITSPIFQHLFV